MNKKLSCILLIDDNDADNFYHKLVIDEQQVANRIEAVETGMQALHYLRKPDAVIPQLIFLDINMPRMNGWEFLEEYNTLSKEQRAKTVIVMLTTSINPEDKLKADAINAVSGFETKPLTAAILNKIISTHFT